jgi:large subunit ribosomal protein L32
MAVPKRRKSKMRKRMRRAASRWRAPKLQTCGECGSTKPGHVACPSCGYYNDRQVLSVDLDA